MSATFVAPSAIDAMVSIESILANVGVGLDLVRYDELDRDEVPDWITSLGQSMKVLNQLQQRLREAIQ